MAAILGARSHEKHVKGVSTDKGREINYIIHSASFSLSPCCVSQFTESDVFFNDAFEWPNHQHTCIRVQNG